MEWNNISMSSAPITDDIAYRFTGITVERDGVQKSIGLDQILIL